MLSFQSKPGARQTFADVFFRHLDELRERALQFTNGHWPDAEDLIQELFIRIAEIGVVGDHIENVEDYLFSMLRNLHYARMRRARTSAIDDLSILDYDSAERSLRAVDRNGILFIREDLHRVCGYLCERKESSRAASIFILRYFLGYFPHEIMLVTQSTSVAVRKALQATRREVRLELERPGVLREIGTQRVSKARAFLEPGDSQGLFLSLRARIFQSSRGSCFDPAVLEHKYDHPEQALGVLELAHIVTCTQCLDRVNHLLGLPLVEERSPDEVVRRDPPSGQAGPPAGGSPTLVSKRPQRKFTDAQRVRQQMNRSLEGVKQHLPRRLFIAIDGNLRASQKITAEHSEQHLDLGLMEQPSFIEVLSEQDVCLGFMPVRERNAEGGLLQSIEVRLSDDRMLTIALSFVSESPAIQVVYDDPFFSHAFLSDDSYDTEDAYSHRNNDEMLEDIGDLFGTWQTASGDAQRSFGRWFRSLFPLEMNPLFTAAVLLGLSSITCFLLWTHSAPKISAAGLLQRAVQSETAASGGGRAGVIYQQVSIRVAGRQLDRAIYREAQRRQRPRKQKPGADEQWLKDRLALAGVDWDEPLSAANYASWHDRLPAKKDVVTRAGDHLLRLTTSTGVDGTVSEESLTVRDSDFHPVKRTITLRDAGEVQIAEVSYNFLPWSAATGNWLEPAAPSSVSDAPDARSHATIRLPHELSDLELDEAELAARSALNQLHADTGEAIRLVREQKGIEVKGVVDTDARKHELLSRLALLPNVHASLLSGEELGARLPSDIASDGGQPSYVYSVQELPSPLQQYEHGKTLSVDRLSSASQNLQDGSLSTVQLESHLSTLRSHFAEAGQLPVYAQGQMGTLSHNYIVSILSSIEANRQILLALGFSDPNPSSTALATDDAGKDIDEEIHRYRQLCLELVSNETGQTRPAPQIAQEIFDVGERIRVRVTRESGTTL